MDGEGVDPDSKLVITKERWARDGRALSGEAAAPGSRLPPGQRLVSGLPVLDLGEQPEVSAADWSFGVSGLVERPLAWDWEAFCTQPQRHVTVDIHCVTTWSSYDNVFSGVPLRHVLDLVRPKADARFVLARSFDGYTTNLPLAALEDDDVLLAHSWNDAPLTREHGGPVRLLVPRLYFWKSAKWLRHLTFLDADRAGFWEARGYHMRGDPWTEERYGS
ncbi:sulfite oxidase-like oxidoreductase [Novispirillum sp. DQ9]|uniref:sulfite oxidase-like oxidoreductase n=1 Tax=Novispirillum sp. DQ9 TaxID=3398612 RepID=UPI003C7B4EA6